MRTAFSAANEESRGYAVYRRHEIVNGTGAFATRDRAIDSIQEGCNGS